MSFRDKAVDNHDAVVLSSATKTMAAVTKRFARPVLVALMGWTGLGCSPSPSGAAPTVPVAEVPAADAVTATPSDAQDPPATVPDPWQLAGLPPPLVPVAEATCRLPAGTPPDFVVGRLRPGGEEAFTVIGAEIEVQLIRGDGRLGSAFFTGSREGLQLRGAMNQGDLHLYASAPVELGGWLVTRHNTQLAVHRITSAGIEAEVGPKQLADVAASAPVRGAVSCKELRVDQVDAFSPWAGLPKPRPSASGWATLVGADPVPLSLKPEAGAVALVPTTGDVGVAVLDSQGSWTRVAIPRNLVLAFGWVPSSRVQARPERVEDLGGGFGFGIGGGGSSLRPILCPHPLAIAVELDGDRFLALRADPGVELTPPGAAADGRVPISFHRRYWFRLAAGASMWVQEKDLNGCAPGGG